MPMCGSGLILLNSLSYNLPQFVQLLVGAIGILGTSSEQSKEMGYAFHLMALDKVRLPRSLRTPPRIPRSIRGLTFYS